MPRIHKSITATILSLLCFMLAAAILLTLTMSGGDKPPLPPTPHADVSIMDAYLSAIAGDIRDADFGARSVRKRFWIDSDVTLCPKPDPARYGETDDPQALKSLLEDAAWLLGGQKTLFATDIEILPGSKITYYLDDSIFAITWKQAFDHFVYTICEVKVGHSSQFRRRLAGDTYNFRYEFTSSQMASEVNAVAASGGDYYRNRQFGIIVYEGEVKRVTNANVTDTCFIDRSGNLIFSRRGEITEMETAQKFVDENDIGFSLAFGPILVENGERCEPADYALGEANANYPRAALCQMDELHYLLVAANSEQGNNAYPTIHTFAKNIAALGCEKAYTLDGGQTADIIMNNKPLNRVQFGKERINSDIIYFATAMPEPNWEDSE